MSITVKQKQFLKSKAHSLNPVVMIGNNGLTENVLKEIEGALTFHELIKVKIAGGEREERKNLSESIAQQTNSDLIQIIGKIAIFFRQSDKSKIKLP